MASRVRDPLYRRIQARRSFGCRQAPRLDTLLFGGTAQDDTPELRFVLGIQDGKPACAIPCSGATSRAGPSGAAMGLRPACFRSAAPLRMTSAGARPADIQRHARVSAGAAQARRSFGCRQASVQGHVSLGGTAQDHTARGAPLSATFRISPSCSV
jgi:hypothetical protein